MTNREIADKCLAAATLGEHDACWTEEQAKAVEVVIAATIAAQSAEIERLRGVIAQHDLCHDQHGKVSAEDFAKGCMAEQHRLYGRSPHADEIARLREALERIEESVSCDCDGGYCINCLARAALKEKP